MYDSLSNVNKLYVCVCLHACVRAYQRTRACICTCACMAVRVCVRIYVCCTHGCLRACKRIFIIVHGGAASENVAPA